MLILLSPLGSSHYLKADMVDGVVVIDVGITRVPDDSKPKGYVITGDVDFENVSKKILFYNPVPGSWTNDYCDIENTLLARKMKLLKIIRIHKPIRENRLLWETHKA
jgi:methylenetetrahydrofolate dehydrogenase (NADP+)/methenyltetrahydrofolate cyclohydrolase